MLTIADRGWGGEPIADKRGRGGPNTPPIMADVIYEQSLRARDLNF